MYCIGIVKTKSKLKANPFLRVRSYPNLQVPFTASTPPQKYVEFLFVLFFVIWVWLMIAIKRIACINHIFSDANKIIICLVQKIFWHAQAQIHSKKKLQMILIERPIAKF